MNTEELARSPPLGGDRERGRGALASDRER